ncbi:MAG: glycosyltransferase [Candidatus Omnitrophica bacterium]|nr:glycosyltransferase [Candidatus Omnitrophota bacterium]
MDLSLVIPALNESKNLSNLIPRIKKALSNLNIEYEIIIVIGSRDILPTTLTKEGHVVVIKQKHRGFGGALVSGFSAASGKFCMTMDADFSHDPIFIKKLWHVRDKADLIVASRFIRGSRYETDLLRKVLSMLLNKIFGYGLSIPLKDISSGFRLYRSSALKSIPLDSHDFDIQQEILIKFYISGYDVIEIPFFYKMRRYGKSHARLIEFGISYIRTFRKIFILRNSIISADYDYRTYSSRVLLRRHWQRKKYKIIKCFLSDAKNGLVADIGSGSNKLAADLKRIVAVDNDIPKLLHLRKIRGDDSRLISAFAERLPFPDGTFSCVICAEVIEYVKGKTLFDELKRVLAKDGLLIIVTTDYSRKLWMGIERIIHKILSGGYVKKNFRQYTRNTLTKILNEHNFSIVDKKYILFSGLCVKARKDLQEREMKHDEA